MGGFSESHLQEGVLEKEGVNNTYYSAVQGIHEDRRLLVEMRKIK
jgi:hypothetical protein